MFSLVKSSASQSSAQRTVHPFSLEEAAGISAELAPIVPADWRVFQTLCEAFLVQDDPYLEADALGDLSAQHDWNERNLVERLEGFVRLGWLRLGRPKVNRVGFGGSRVGEGVALVEITFLGLDAYCRAGGRVDYPALVREVACCLVHEDRVDNGTRLRGALLSAGARLSRRLPDLLLAHAVEALEKVGLVETCQQWGGTLGFQIGRVAPELRRWVEAQSEDTPALAVAA